MECACEQLKDGIDLCAAHGTEFRAEMQKVVTERDKARADVKRLTEIRCTVREHMGVEKVVAKIGLGESLLPDPELGQDVAFFAYIITSQNSQIDVLKDLLHRVSGRGSTINLDKDVGAALAGVPPTGVSDGYAETHASAKR